MRALTVASWLLIATVFVVVLVVAKNLLIPFVVAVGIWYLINALKQIYGRIKIGRFKLPQWVCLTASSATILLFVFFIIEMITRTINAMRKAAPEYKVNIDRMMEKALTRFGVDEIPNISAMASEIDLSEMISLALNSVSAFAGNAVLILVYVMFLLLEQHLFRKKLYALFPNPERQHQVNEVLEHINSAIQTYVSVKTITSLLTGGLSYIVLAAVGVDFAIFWAFLIFLLNYIPTVGSLIATVFPAIVAFVQFDTFGPGITVLLGVVTVQTAIGNFLEPRLMGKSLNISPLVVILSLVLWGMIWGVAGMVLCVPITVIMMIVMAEFQSTRFIAILLSGNGEIVRYVKKTRGEGYAVKK